MGHFVVKAVADLAPSDGLRTAFGVPTEAGICESGLPWSISHADSHLAENLSDFLDPKSEEPLSSQAAAGLLVRSIRAEKPMPLELFDLLRELAAQRTGALRPSRANSFEALDGMAEQIHHYRSLLRPITEHIDSAEEIL
jgi:hypothetical protein